MITPENLNKAKEAYEKAASKLNSATIDRDTFQTYFDEVERGVWSSVDIPAEGPFTIEQAKLIRISIDRDYGYPTVYVNPIIWGLAKTKLSELKSEVIALAKESETKKATYDKVTKQFSEQVDSTLEGAILGTGISASLTQAKIEQATELKKAEIKSNEQSKTNRLIVTTFVGMLALMVFGFILAKVLK